MRHAHLPFLFFLLLPSALLAAPGSAQDAVIQVENVRMDYAQVLRVEPVFQTLSATRMEQQCNGRPVPVKTPAKALSRIVGKVKDALSPNDGDVAAADSGDCHLVAIAREFRRPIAFDVDYMYKGMKYRSRLASDPGNRLQVRVSVTPYVSAASR